MESTFLITGENLIGSIATAILQLKKLRENKSLTKDISFFLRIIDFLDHAKKEDYEQLLYDKHFVVSKDILSDLHNELISINEKIDFQEIKQTLGNINTESTKEYIEASMGKLKEIALILVQMKNKKENYM